MKEGDVGVLRILPRRVGSGGGAMIGEVTLSTVLMSSSVAMEEGFKWGFSPAYSRV